MADVVLTDDEIEKWKLQLREAETDLFEARARVDSLKKKLDAVAALTGVTGGEKHKLSTDDVFNVFLAHEGPLSLAFLKERLKLKGQTPAYFYTIMHRLKMEEKLLQLPDGTYVRPQWNGNGS